jgi:hypothetical protein
MSQTLEKACCAKLPVEALRALASLRSAPGVNVKLEESHAWVHWDAPNQTVVERILPVTGARVYVRRGDCWYLHRAHLPAFDVPDLSDARPLCDLLLPKPARAHAASAAQPKPVLLRLVPDHRPRPATALLCSITELARWADSASGPRLASIRAAFCNDRTLLVGKRLPLLRECKRLWGNQVVAPLGLRPEPDLGERAICEALSVSDCELILLDTDKADVVPSDALQPLTRAGIRLLASQS